MRIEPLSRHPLAIPAIAGWYNDEWGFLHPEETAADIEAEFAEQFAVGGLPEVFVALSGSEPIGAALLRIREVASLPEYEHWLGGVYVPGTHRDRGVASALVRHVMNEAYDRYAAQRLYLQTEQFDGGLYGRLGWKKLTMVRTNERDRMVMVTELPSLAAIDHTSARPAD